MLAGEEDELAGLIHGRDDGDVRQVTVSKGQASINHESETCGTSRPSTGCWVVGHDNIPFLDIPFEIFDLESDSRTHCSEVNRKMGRLLESMSDTTLTLALES